MYQSWEEEEMIREWLTTQHIPTLAKRLGFDAGKLYRLSLIHISEPTRQY